jgi:hypothetical protein
MDLNRRMLALNHLEIIKRNALTFVLYEANNEDNNDDDVMTKVT